MSNKSITIELIICIFVFAQTPLVAQPTDQLARMRQINPSLPEPLYIDSQRVQSNSIATHESKHLILLTDVRDRNDIDELPVVFDAAVAQWCSYFDVKIDKADAWQLRGILIADKPKFIKAHLFPDGLPEFPAGFQSGHEMWVYLQPGKYYTRHLLLHEGTHSFMQWFLGGTGAPWYTEGMAELLAVHSWSNDKLKLNFRLTDRRQAEYWGRIKLIQEDCRDEKAMSLEDVFNIPPTAFRDVRFYAWSWAACEFFSNHPDSKTAFANLKTIASQSPNQFNQSFVDAINAKRNELERDWKLFVNEIDFGFDVARGRLHTIESKGPNDFLLDPAISWQMTPLQIEAGQQLEINSSGRFTVANENGTAWPCESDGITIEYYRGKPLGQLVAGIIGADGNFTGPLNPTGTITKEPIHSDRAGHLCFRINESPARLSDNQGRLEIKVRMIGDNEVTD